MKLNFKGILLFPILLLIFFTCKHDPTVTPDPDNPGQCDTTSVTFNGAVVPILTTNCTSCHSGLTPVAGIDLTDYQQVSVLAQNGALIGVLKHLQGYSPMPRNQPKLTDCDISKVEIWIRDTTFINDPGGIPCNPDTVYFVNTILPLLQSSCGNSGCHDQASASDGVILTDYVNIINTGGVQAGNPGNSELYEKITESDPDKVMPPPPKAPLIQSQIAAIQKWIIQGAKNNSCDSEDCDSVNVTFSQNVFTLIQNKCLGCHSGGSPSGGVSLTNYNEIKTIAEGGALLGVITHSPGYSPMPKNGNKLSICNIAQIKKWINDGMPNN